MSWREFQLKRYGFMRQQKEQRDLSGIVAYMVYLSIPEKGKKQSFAQWWHSDNKKGVEDWQKQALLDAQKQAIEEAKQKKLNGPNK